MNREAALAAFESLLDASENDCAGKILSALVPIFHEKVHGQTLSKESEELRLAICEFLIKLLNRPSSDAALDVFFAQLFDIYCAFAQDAFHDVNMKAMDALKLLAQKVPEKIRTVLSRATVACLENLSHRRSAVRKCSLETLYYVLPCGRESLIALMGDTVIPSLRRIRFDENNNVRKQLGIAVCHFLQSFPPFVLDDRNIRGNLLTLVAGLLGDHDIALASHVYVALNDVAAQWVQVNTASVIGTSATGSSGGNVMETDDSPNAASAISSDVAAAAAAAAPDATIANYSEVEELYNRTARALHDHDHAPVSTGTTAAPSSLRLISPTELPIVFQGRAPPATVSYAAYALPGTLPLLLQDLEDWTARAQVWAAHALRAYLVLIEGHVVAMLEPLLIALCKAMDTEEPEASAIVQDCSRVLALFVSSDALLGVMLPILQGTRPVPAFRQFFSAVFGVLAKCLSSMTREELITHGSALCSTLVGPKVIDVQAPETAAALVQVLRTYVEKLFPEQSEQGLIYSIDNSFSNVQTFTNLLLALLSVQSEYCDEHVQKIGRDVSHTLASRLHFSGPEELFGKQLPVLLDNIIQKPESWTLHNLSRFRLGALLIHYNMSFGFLDDDTMQSALERAFRAIQVTCDPNLDATMRVAQLSILDHFITRGQGDADVHGLGDHAYGGEGSQDAMTTASCRVRVGISQFGAYLFRDIIVPNCIWRVGLVAAAVRKAALACGVSFVAHKLLTCAQALEVMPVLSPVAKSCLSDDDAATRHLSVRLLTGIFQAIGPDSLDHEAVRQLYHEIMKRMDDSNDAVRIVCCACISAFVDATIANELRGVPLEYMIDQMLIHLDDTEAVVQDAVLSTLQALAKVDVGYARRKTSEALPKHRNPTYSRKLLDYIDSLPVQVDSQSLQIQTETPHSTITDAPSVDMDIL